MADPQGEVAKTFQDLGVCVVQQCAKIRQQGILISPSNDCAGIILKPSQHILKTNFDSSCYNKDADFQYTFLNASINSRYL